MISIKSKLVEKINFSAIKTDQGHKYSYGHLITYDCHFMKQICTFPEGLADLKSTAMPLTV